jgi:predicted branched-subunit amino acid permease
MSAMNKAENPYAENHRALGGFFFFFMIFWVVVGILGAVLSAKPFLALAYACPFVLFFGWLARGCRRRSETARKAAEITGAIMVLFFPIGTLLAFFAVLPLTKWEPSRADTQADIQS